LSDAIGTSGLFDLALANELYGTLLGPVEALVKDKRSLLIVPSGALTALPFHLLVTEKPSAAIPETLAGDRDAAWLIRRQAVSVLPSVASLKALRAFARNNHAARPMTGLVIRRSTRPEKAPTSGQRARSRWPHATSARPRIPISGAAPTSIAHGSLPRWRRCRIRRTNCMQWRGILVRRLPTSTSVRTPARPP
jgi:hypothetical protein